MATPKKKTARVAKSKTKAKSKTAHGKAAAPKKAALKKNSAQKPVAKKTKASKGKANKTPSRSKQKLPPKSKPSALVRVARTAKAAVQALVSTKAKPAASARSGRKTDYSDLLSPLEDRVLVLIEPASEITVSGLYIPGTVSERPTRGRVVAVGPGLRNKKGQLRPLDVTVGETVLFAESAGSKLMLDGSELLVLRETDVLGVVA